MAFNPALLLSKFGVVKTIIKKYVFSFPPPSVVNVVDILDKVLMGKLASNGLSL